ncbi:MAG: hypothetical protein Q7T18_03275, partial [Sedimentisphaerales bacterium]|nr:hypothetical protein [Sedimentisphaerales bacterium]
IFILGVVCLWLSWVCGTKAPLQVAASGLDVYLSLSGVFLFLSGWLGVVWGISLMLFPSAREYIFGRTNKK